MARIFKNENELKQYFYKVESKVVDAVSNKLLKDFQDHLDKTIYGVPGVDYQRYYKKGGFYSGWETITGVKSAINDYVKTLMYNPNKLISYESDLKNGQIAHGGRGYEDVRAAMVSILNDASFNDFASVNGGAKYLQNGGIGYWDSYLKDAEDKIDKWFDEEFSKYGIRRG